MSGTLPISSFYSYLSITFWPTNYCPWWAYKILEKRLHITRSKRQKDNISWWISFTFALFTKVMKVLTPIIIDWGWFVLNIWKSGKKNFVFVSSSSFGLCILLLRTFRYTGKHVCLTFKDLYFFVFSLNTRQMFVTHLQTKNMQKLFRIIYESYLVSSGQPLTFVTKM